MKNSNSVLVTATSFKSTLSWKCLPIKRHIPHPHKPITRKYPWSREGGWKTTYWTSILSYSQTQCKASAMKCCLVSSCRAWAQIKKNKSNRGGRCTDLCRASADRNQITPVGLRCFSPIFTNMLENTRKFLCSYIPEHIQMAFSFHFEFSFTWIPWAEAFKRKEVSSEQAKAPTTTKRITATRTITSSSSSQVYCAYTLVHLWEQSHRLVCRYNTERKITRFKWR